MADAAEDGWITGRGGYRVSLGAESCAVPLCWGMNRSWLLQLPSTPPAVFVLPKKHAGGGG